MIVLMLLSVTACFIQFIINSLSCQVNTKTKAEFPRPGDLDSFEGVE